jgi:hypothetical protein
LVEPALQLGLAKAIALMCPTTTIADVDRHNEVFEAAIRELVGS